MFIYEKVATGMENLKMQLLCWCNKRTGIYGPEIIRFHAPSNRADNGNLGNFEPVDRNGTVFAPKEHLYQKVAPCKEKLKMESLCP